MKLSEAGKWLLAVIMVFNIQDQAGSHPASYFLFFKLPNYT
jgi:hypothetical protein